jgi:HK97 family phage portal protein
MLKMPWHWGRKSDSLDILQMVGLPEGTIPSINDKSYSTAFEVSAWVFACVTSIASAVGSVVLQTQEAGKDGEWEGSGVNKLLTLLSYTNSDQNIVDLLEMTAGWLALDGNAYWHLMRFPEGAKYPSAIRVLPSDRVTIETGKGIRSNIVKGYRVMGADPDFLPDTDVVHFRTFSVHPIYGIPPVKPLEPVINLFSALTRYKYSLMKSGGLVPSVLKFKKVINEEERKKMNLIWSMWRGIDNEGKPLILGMDSEFQTVGADPDKVAGLALSHEARETICGLYGVPPGVVGLLQDANYSNLRVQRKAFWTETVIPRYVRRIEGSANEQLAWQFEEPSKRYRVVLSTAHIDALQEDRKDMATTNAILIRSGQRTPNEVRIEDGLEPLPGGDTLQVGASVASATSTTL